jgi:hypothetical protein
MKAAQRPSPSRPPRTWTCSPRRSPRASSGCRRSRPCSAASPSTPRPPRHRRGDAGARIRCPGGGTGAGDRGRRLHPALAPAREVPPAAAGAVRRLRPAGVREDGVDAGGRAAGAEPVAVRHPHPRGHRRPGVEEAVPALLGADVGGIILIRYASLPMVKRQAERRARRGGGEQVPPGPTGSPGVGAGSAPATFPTTPNRLTRRSSKPRVMPASVGRSLWARSP